MTRRSTTASFAPGAYVFPGGGIDAPDAAAHAQAARRARPERPAPDAGHCRHPRKFRRAGRAAGAPRRRPPGRRRRHRRARPPRAPFAAQCAARGLPLAADEVFVLAHWITDRDLPRRFDVPFLVARMPDGQTPVADEAEQFEPVLGAPGRRAGAARGGQLLHDLPDHPHAGAAGRLRHRGRRAAGLRRDEQPLWTSCPRAGLLAGAGGALHGARDALTASSPWSAPTARSCTRWTGRATQPVPLLKNVMRLTAPNPGAMTGPGTNSYLVGDPATGYIAIDPGPGRRRPHRAAVARAPGGDIRMIVCTHSHPDHSPGAKPLQALCQDAPADPGPALGADGARRPASSRPTARCKIRSCLR